MLSSDDIAGFFVEYSSFNTEDYLLIDYSFQTTLEPRLAAATLACEQSTVQWRRPGRDEDFRKLFGAKVVSFSAKKSGDRHICEVLIAHPWANFGPRISNLLSAIAGEGPFYCPGIQEIKLTDIHFPASFLAAFDGPQFGIEGLRRQLQVYDRPFFIGVVKPNLGLDPESFGALAYESWMGGLDIAKDDEMLGEHPASSLSSRMHAVHGFRRKAEEQTKLPKMMIANITDEVDAMEACYTKATAAGANAVMVNALFTGLSSIRLLRKKAKVPIMGHFTGMALYDRPQFGIDGGVLVKLMRLAGCDLIGIPGFGERMKQSNGAVLRNILACLSPMGSLKTALPIPGGSDWAGSLKGVYDKIGHADFGFISGRGVYGHPNGPRAGAQSLHDAWQAIKSGVSIGEYAKNHPALAQALAMQR